MRGRSYEGLENRARAKIWYRLAILRDVKCTQAFDRLLDGRMMSTQEERTLVTHLCCSHPIFIHLFHICRCIYIYVISSIVNVPTDRRRNGIPSRARMA